MPFACLPNPACLVASPFFALPAQRRRANGSPADLTAAAYHALGIPADQVVADREGRPILLTEGKPVAALIG